MPHVDLQITPATNIKDLVAALPIAADVLTQFGLGCSGCGVSKYETIEQGAATSIVAAVAPEFARTGGHYLDDGKEAYTVPNDAQLAQHPHGVKQWALDADAAQRLWAVSTDLTQP